MHCFVTGPPASSASASRLHALGPRLAQVGMHTAFRRFPESPAAAGAKEGSPRLSAGAVAMQQMLRGIRLRAARRRAAALTHG